MRMRERFFCDVLAVRGLEARLLVGLLRVGPHHPRPRQVLLRDRVHGRELGLHLLEQVVDLAPEVPHEHGDEDERHEGQGQQPGADPVHQADRAREGREGGGRVHDAGPEHHAHRRHVVRGPAHEVADSALLVVARGEAREVLEEPIAQLVLDLAADPDEHHPHLVAEDTFRDHEGDDGTRVEPELLARDLAVEVVDRGAQHPGRGHGQRGGEEQGDETPDQGAPVALDGGEEPPKMRERYRDLALAAATVRRARRSRSRAWLARRRRGRFSFSQVSASRCQG